MATPAGNAICPLCNGSVRSWQIDPFVQAVECERCGRFDISSETIADVLEPKPQLKPSLSAYCRRLRWPGARPPLIRSDTIADFIRTLPRYTPLEKLDNLLELVGRMSPALGEPAAVSPERDYPLLIARDAEEVWFLMNELQRRGYLDGLDSERPTLTMRGWERLEEIKRAGRLSNRAFVAMWFDKTTDALYDNAIKPAILDAKYDPLRIDKHEHVNRIDDEIIGQIRRSRFMIADLTGQRHGAYFEAGMMFGLGRTVIWLCDKKELDEGRLHFDVRQFNFIAYESVEDAKKRLYHRILAIEGEGPGQFEKPQ